MSINDYKFNEYCEEEYESLHGSSFVPSALNKFESQNKSDMNPTVSLLRNTCNKYCI